MNHKKLSLSDLYVAWQITGQQEALSAMRLHERPDSKNAATALDYWKAKHMEIHNLILQRVANIEL